MELERPRHLQVITCAAPDERHPGPEHAVSATDDLLLVAGEAVAEQQERPVREIVASRHTPRDACPRSAQVA